MITVFSQVSYIDEKAYVYDCSIDTNAWNEDVVFFRYGESDSPPEIDSIISHFAIEFPTLRNIIMAATYDAECWHEYNISSAFRSYKIKENKEYFVFDDFIISKKFIKDSYEILKNMWEDEKEEENNESKEK